jgi:ATP-dependent exoDNAse (exonuclease V) beta subunit
MPFLKWDIFDHKKSNVVWAPFEDKEKQLDAIIPLTLGSKLAQSDFADIYAEEAVMAYLDSLNMIYVALTRAEDVFLGIVPFREKINSQNSLQIQIQQALMYSKDDEGVLSLSDYFNSETKVFELGDWPINQEREVKESVVNQLSWSYQNWAQLLKVKKYAVDFSAEGLKQRKKQNFGLLVHEILEVSKSKKDTKLNLASFYYEGRLTLEEKDDVEKQLDALFSNSLFASWFETDGVLLAEQGILLPGGKMKRPDRIILKEDHAMVVDFKTGEPYEKHKKQVGEYMDLVAQLIGKPAKGYLCYLENGEIIEL